MRREEGLTNAVLLCLGYWAIHSKERREWGGERGREIKYLVGEALERRREFVWLNCKILLDSTRHRGVWIVSTSQGSVCASLYVLSISLKNQIPSH